jgi:hypothetical protein
MMTLSGRYINRTEGAPSLEDIALGLSRMPRFGGQTKFLWTVADHVVCAHEYVQVMRVKYWDTLFGGASLFLPLHVLLHDAHEAMTSDIPTTFKTQDMKDLQYTLDKRIYESLRLPLPNSMELSYIKAVDKAMLLAEASVVAPRATYEKICAETNDIAMPTALIVVEQHIHNDVVAREAFLDICLANGLTTVIPYEEEAYER